MKIFFYELKKLISYRAFLFIVAVCLVIGAISSISNIRSNDSSPGDYKRIVSATSQMSYTQKSEYLDNQLEAQLTGNSDYSSQAIYTAKEQLELINGYTDYLDSIEERCSSITRMSLLVDKDSFTYKNAGKTQYAYRNIRHTSLPFDVSQGIENILLNHVSDILLLFALFAAAIFVFIKDKETGMMNLLYSYPKGRAELCISKIGVLLFFSFVLSFLFMGELSIINGIMYGLGDLSRPIQSVTGFFECSFNLNVWQYLVISFIFKSLGGFLWSMLFAVICTTASNNVQIYSMSIFISVAEAWLYSGISQVSNLGLLHDLNLISFVKPENVYSAYRNLNIGGTPVSVVIAIPVSWLLLLIIISSSVIIIFSGGKNQEYKKVKIGKVKNSSEKVHRRMYYAFWKSFILQGSVLVIGIWSVFTVIYQLNFTKSITLVDFYYEQYTTNNAGIITEHIDSIIANDEEYFTDLDNKMFSGQMTMSELNQYQTEQNREDALLQFKSKVNEIRNKTNTLIFYDSGYKRAFGIDSNRELLQMFLLIMLLCVLCVSPLISYDKGRGIQNVIYSTATGKKAYIKRNVVITLIYSIFASTSVMIPYFINILKKYGAQGITSPVQSIKELTSFPIPLNIWQYAIALFVFRTLIIILFSMIMLGVSYKSNSRFNATLINATVFIIPLLIINIS